MPKYYSNININSFGGSTTSTGLTLDSNGDIKSEVISSGSTLLIRRETIRYVDPINGDDTAASLNWATDNFNYPYQTYSAAQSASSPGETIVLFPGAYTSTMTLVDGVNVYCMSGVSISGGFASSSSITCKVLGHAKFEGTSSVPALSISGTTPSSDITFEFDTISGTRTYGIFHEQDGTLTVRGNSIFCGNPMRIQLGSKDVRMDIRDYIKSYNQDGCVFGKDTSAPYPAMQGLILINCPLIESTSSSAYRSCLYFHTGFIGSNGDDYKIVINSKEIRQSTSPVVESYPNIISSCVWIDGGDNIHIYGNLEGNLCHCVSNRGGGATPHYGQFYFYGDMHSNIEVISSNVKVANGNGWHSISAQDGYLSTEGNGVSGGLVETANIWNSIHGGTPGSMYFKNCILYNKAANSNILELNQPFGINNANLYDCIMYSEGSTGYSATTVQTGKTVNYHNVRSNKDNNINVTNNFTGGATFTYDINLVIPK